MIHAFPPLDRFRGHEWSEPVTNPTEAIDAIKAALAIQLKDAGKELQHEASEWLKIVELATRERLSGQMTGDRFLLLLNQARTSMQLVAANMLVEREAAMLNALQTAVLAAAKLAI
jgi:hypothetical protein